MIASLLIALQSAAAPPTVENVRILRDPWGVPHCLSDSDYGALYGYGWALGEDQLENALRALWTAQGRSTEIEGVEVLPVDRTWRLLRLVADVERDYAGYSQLTRDAAEGFADGLNAYMRAHPEQVPDWAEPVRPSWPLALGRLIGFLPQISEANADLRQRCLRLATLSTGTSEEHWRIYGSNAWAVGPSKLEGGQAALVTDPHLPWKHEFRMVEVHLRGANFEVAGAAFLGVPLPVFARTQHCAWGWTWNSPDHADAYLLELDPDDPERYLLDGESIPFERETHTYRLPDGSSTSEVLRWSVHGPVSCHDLGNGEAVALRLSSFGQAGGPEQMRAMMQARNREELADALDMLQVGHFNFVSADVHGSIEYTWGGRIPRRAEGARWEGVLDGTTSSTLWGDEEVWAWRELPRLVDPEQGWVQNCNNRPSDTTGSDADPDEEAWPEYVVGRDRDTARAWFLRQQLAETESFDREAVRALATDGRVIPYEPVMGQLRHAWEQFGADYPQRDAVASHIELLLSWDGMPETRSTAMLLFVLFVRERNNGGVFPAVSLLERELDSIDQEAAYSMFADVTQAQSELAELAPLPRVPWGMVHVIRRNGRAFPVASGMYPAISLFNANIDTSISDPFQITCRVGSAYTAAHWLGEGGIESWSVLPLGQTDDTDKPYWSTMTELYAQRELKPLPFTDEQLAAYPMQEQVLELPAREGAEASGR